MRKNLLIESKVQDSKLIEKLRKSRWLKNHWICGLFLFSVNALLFFSVGLILYIIILYLTFPFLHLLVMIVAVIVSFYCWIIFHKIWDGTNKNRFIMGMIGSSFYAIMALIFYYKYVTIEPSFPGDDVFMAALGQWIAMIVTTVAFISCIVMTAIPKRTVKL